MDQVLKRERVHFSRSEAHVLSQEIKPIFVKE